MRDEPSELAVVERAYEDYHRDVYRFLLRRTHDRSDAEAYHTAWWNPDGSHQYFQSHGTCFSPWAQRASNAETETRFHTRLSPLLDNSPWVYGVGAAFDFVHSDLTPTTVHTFTDFAVYSLGREFESLPLTRIRRQHDPRSPDPSAGVRANYVSFIYGSCKPAGDTGCPYPLEVQVWPACVRTLADYKATPFSSELAPHEKMTLRGVPAAFFNEGVQFRRVELYTGHVTVVVFGLERATVLRAAAALRGENTAVSAAADLPAPEPGAVEGTLDC